eukprot:m.157887 g.157887  ORF g.157887 m.157887 type:complete len:412 (+) comp14488_c0_seq2:217-1452(+)
MLGSTQDGRSGVEASLTQKLLSGLITAEEFVAIKAVVEQPCSEDMLSPGPPELLPGPAQTPHTPPPSVDVTTDTAGLNSNERGEAACGEADEAGEAEGDGDEVVALLRRKRSSGVITAEEHRRILAVHQRGLRADTPDESDTDADSVTDSCSAGAGEDACGATDEPAEPSTRPISRRISGSWEWIESLMRRDRLSAAELTEGGHGATRRRSWLGGSDSLTSADRGRSRRRRPGPVEQTSPPRQSFIASLTPTSASPSPAREPELVVSEEPARPSFPLVYDPWSEQSRRQSQQHKDGVARVAGSTGSLGRASSGSASARGSATSTGPSPLPEWLFESRGSGSSPASPSQHRRGSGSFGRPRSHTNPPAPIRLYQRRGGDAGLEALGSPTAPPAPIAFSRPRSATFPSAAPTS